MLRPLSLSELCCPETGLALRPEQPPLLTACMQLTIANLLASAATYLLEWLLP